MTHTDQNTISNLQGQIAALTAALTVSKNQLASFEKNMEERIRFDMLLSEISAHFINLMPDQIDSEIKTAQQRICECLGLDLTTLWQRDAENPNEFILTHFYRSMDGPPVPDRMNASKYLPWSLLQAMSGKIIAISSTENAPPEAACEVEVWRHYNIKASLGIPLSIGDEPPFGSVGFIDMRSEREWSDTIIKRLQLVAQIFANTLARKRSDEALRENELRLALATEAAGAGLWIMNLDTQKVWVSAKLRELFHFAENEDVTYQSFFEKIHPDDFDRVRQSVEETIGSGTNLHVDYRILLPDEDIRWICSRGNRLVKKDGNPDRLMGVSVDNTERMTLENELRENLQFESLLAEISADFVNLPADKVDSGIEDAQRRVCECLGLDASVLWQYSAEAPGTIRMTHVYRPLGGPPAPEPMYANDYFPWCQAQLEAGRIVVVSSLNDLPAEASRDKEVWGHFGIKTSLTFPLSPGGGPLAGALSFNTMQFERTWPAPVVKKLRLVAEIFANALLRKQMETRLMEHVQNIEALKQQLENENLYLQREIKFLGDQGHIVGRSLAIKRILAEAEQVAATDSTVLILGETGTGKEMLARAIHRMSGRKDRPMITINCASLPPTLIESELFGREKGAYTGALTKMAGRFEIADGSTLFLDEIGELPMELQSKLLRVLEEGVFERLGSTKSLRVNVRIIAATNRDIDAEVAQGRFRKDLFYRLSVFPLVLPPLRERTEDIPLLVWAFVKEFEKRMGKEIETVSRKTMASLQSYSWPGNVRELRNVIEHAMILAGNSTLVVNFPRSGSKETEEVHLLGDLERKHIVSVLEKTGWRVGVAAGILGLKRSTLYSRMKKLEIRRPGV